jgi:hypothetical protein
MARSRRADLEALILNDARRLRDACDDDGDGIALGLVANTQAYEAWEALNASLMAYDALDPDDINNVTHTANAAGPRTEHQAANLIVPFQASLRYRLLSQLRIRASLSHGWEQREGMTDSEMEFITKRPHTSVSAARNFLAGAGWIYDTGQRRKTPTMRPAIVWALTDAGIRTFDTAQGAA